MNKTNFGAMIAAVVSMLYAPLGWCPPPPADGTFLPTGQTYSLGAVPIGSTSSVAVTFFVAPAYASSAPYAIAPLFSAYLAFGTAFYSIDPNGTTCVPGALVTTTSGCTVVVRFSPAFQQGLRSENVVVSAAPVSRPNEVNTVAYATITATAVPAVPIPALSPLGHLVLLAALMLTSGWFLGRRK